MPPLASGTIAKLSGAPSKLEAWAQRRSTGVSESSSFGRRFASVAKIGTAFSKAFLSVMTVMKRSGPWPAVNFSDRHSNRPRSFARS